MSDKKEFSGKIAIVSGASRGIGRAIARRLIALDASVVGLARPSPEFAALGLELGFRTIEADLADPVATSAAAEAALPADYLVNCAGINILEPFVNITVANFAQVQSVNLIAPMILSRAFARDCISRGAGGAIVNVSSLSAFAGFAEHAAYCASKAGLDAMGRVMANELGPHGIRVNSVNPGVTLTEMAAEAWSSSTKSGPMLQRTPLGRFADPDEVADAVLFLLSDAATMITGTTLSIDGGFRSA